MLSSLNDDVTLKSSPSATISKCGFRLLLSRSASTWASLFETSMLSATALRHDAGNGSRSHGNVPADKREPLRVQMIYVQDKKTSTRNRAWSMASMQDSRDKRGLHVLIGWASKSRDTPPGAPRLPRQVHPRDPLQVSGPWVHLYCDSSHISAYPKIST